MANCHDLFLNFNDNITLDSEKKSSLRTSRNAIRDDIKKYFDEDLNVTMPKFWGQGSYMMNTIIKPLEGEYDIDDGVYLEHLSEDNESDWPTVGTVHTWVVNAIQDRTSTEPQDKNTCVRAIYKNDYHIDIPIYIKGKNSDHPKLAHKSKGWIDSDPKELTNWFNDEVGAKDAQIKRIVRYFKAWKDFEKNEDKFPSGMIFTVLAANHFIEGYEDTDDASLIAIAQSIYDALNYNFSLSRPVFPNEELLEGWSASAEKNFLDKLSVFISKGQEALETDSKEEASEIWIKLLGDRFPEYVSPKEENRVDGGHALKTVEPAILGNYGRSS